MKFRQAATRPLRAMGAMRKAWQGLAVVGLAFYGTWLIYRPAAFLVAAGLLFLDLATDRS